MERTTAARDGCRSREHQGPEGFIGIFVKGAMRLTTWFLAGAELPDVRGHQVACSQKGELWSSEGEPEACPLTISSTRLSRGDDLAVGLSVSASIGPEVVAFLKKAAPIRSYLDIALAAGAGPSAITGAAHAKGWALAVGKQSGLPLQSSAPAGFTCSSRHLQAARCYSVITGNDARHPTLRGPESRILPLVHCSRLTGLAVSGEARRPAFAFFYSYGRAVPVTRCIRSRCQRSLIHKPELLVLIGLCSIEHAQHRSLP